MRGCHPILAASASSSRQPTAATSVRCSARQTWTTIRCSRPTGNDRLHLGPRGIGRSVPREGGRQRPRTSDRRSGIRRSGGVLARTASSSCSSARAAAAFARSVDDGSADAAREGADVRDRAATSGRRGRRTANGSRSRRIAAATLPFAHGRWERLQLVDIYIVRPDGSGLKRITEHGNFCGSPKWSADSRRVIAYCMTAEQTLGERRAVRVRSRRQRHAAGVVRGRDRRRPKSCRRARASSSTRRYVGDDIGYIRKDAQGPGAGIYYTDGRSGPKGDIRTAAWSPDGARVVFHRRLTAPPPTWQKTFSRLPGYEMTSDRDSAVVQSVGRSLRDDRPTADPAPARLEHRRRGHRHGQAR